MPEIEMAGAGARFLDRLVAGLNGAARIWFRGGHK